MLTGCTFGNAVNQASTPLNGQLQEEQPLSFTVVYADGDRAHKQGISTVISNFEKSHPNIVVNEINETWAGSYADFLKMKDAVGEFPDLIEMRDTQLFTDAGLLHPMPGDLIGLFEAAPEVNEAVYTLPLEKPAPHGVIYNKKVFAQAGITESPETFDEFLLYCEKIKRLGVQPIVVGGKDIWHMGFWINKFLIDEVYIKNPDWNAQRGEGKVSWTDAGPMSAMQKLKFLWDNGYVASGFTGTADNQTASILLSGQAAMLYSGPWMFNQISSADPTFAFGFFALPDQQGNINVAGAPTTSGWAISAEAAKNPEKLKSIKQFLHYFFDENQYALFLQAVNGIPATRADADYPVIEPMEAVLRMMKDGKTKQSAYLNTFSGKNTAPPQFRDWFYRAIQDVLNDKLGLDEAMREADQEWNAQVKAMQVPTGS